MKHTFFQRVYDFLQLIRWPNLLVIILTQFLLRHAIIKPVYVIVGISPAMSTPLFWLLVGITVIIAAAGYIINDYFDLRTDRINRPDKLILGRTFRRRQAIKYNLILNVIALAGGVYLGFQAHSWRLSLIFPLMMVLLVLYSARYKNTILWGNIAVAFMSAMVVIIVWLFEFFMLRMQPDAFVSLSSDLSLINKLFLFYAGFAFIISMCRELTKDIQDLPGDSATNNHTLPVMRGVKVSGYWLMVFSLLTLGFTAWSLLLLSRLGWAIPMAYYLLTVVPLLLFAFYRILKAKQPEDYKSISLIFKIIMVAGVLGLQPLAMVFG